MAEKPMVPTDYDLVDIDTEDVVLFQIPREGPYEEIQLQLGDEKGNQTLQKVVAVINKGRATLVRGDPKIDGESPELA